MLYKAVGILIVYVFFAIGNTATAQATTVFKNISITQTLPCPGPNCIGTCTFEDFFIVAIDKEGPNLLVTSLKDNFHLSAVSVDRPGSKCKADRNFAGGMILDIKFVQPGGTITTCALATLAACGIVVLPGLSGEPAGLERIGVVKSFTFKYKFHAICKCDKLMNDGLLVIDLAFKDGKFFVDGNEIP